MTLETIKEFYRQKRIRRILNLYSNLQPYGVVPTRHGGVNLSSKNKISVVSRDALFHFAFVMFTLLLANAVLRLLVPFTFKTSITHNPLALFLRFLPNVFIAFLAVEAADYLLARTTTFLDWVMDYFLPAAVILFLVTGYIGIRYFNKGEQWQNQLTGWRDRVNTRIQSRPIPFPVSPRSGKNWFFVLNEKSELLPLTHNEATEACKKP